MREQLGYRLFDADNHYYEAEDAFLRHMDSRIAHKAPRWVQMPDGKRRLIFGDRMNRFVGADHTFSEVAKAGIMAPGAAAFVAGQDGELVPTPADLLPLAEEMAASHPQVGVTVLCPGNTDTAVMEAERNRPAALGEEQRTDDAEAWRVGIRDSFTGPTGRTADDVAGQLIEGVEDDRLFVLTHPDMAPILEARLTRLSDAVVSEAARVSDRDAPG